MFRNKRYSKSEHQLIHPSTNFYQKRSGTAEHQLSFLNSVLAGQNINHLSSISGLEKQIINSLLNYLFAALL
jgi:hypothetical protein